MVKGHEKAFGYYLGDDIVYFLNAADPDDWAPVPAQLSPQNV